MLDLTYSWQSHLSKKSRSRTLGHRVCLESLSRTITISTIQALTHRYHRFREIHFNATDMNNAKLNVKSWQSHSRMESRSRAPVHSACLKSMSRKIITQDFNTSSNHCFREMHFNVRLDIYCWSMDGLMDGDSNFYKQVRQIVNICCCDWHCKGELNKAYPDRALERGSIQINILLISLQKHLGPVVRSINSLTNSLVVKMLTVLVNTISNSQVFLQKKSE